LRGAKPSSRGEGAIELRCALLRRRKRLNRGSRRALHQPRGAEAVVRAWDRDEPGETGGLRVEVIELETGTTN
jgi:hypothetical protein